MSDYRIEHRLTRKCNYACSYCYEDFNDSFKNIDVNFDDLKSFLDQLLNLYDSIEYNIIGGEPTRHPEFYKLIEFLSGFNNVNILITSNGSKKLNTNNLPTNTEIVYSFHEEFTSVKKFIERIKHTKEFIRCINVVDNEECLEELQKEFGDIVHIYPKLGRLYEEPNSKFRDLPNELIIDKWYFKNGLYERWQNNDCKTIGKRCNVQEFECVIQDNKVYQCVYYANQEKKAKNLSEFDPNKSLLCTQQYCLFNCVNII